MRRADERGGQAGKPTRRIYLAERYLPEGRMDLALADSSLAVRATEELLAQGVDVRYLYLTLIPLDEICVAAFAAASAEEVRRLIQLAGIPYDRVVEAVRIGRGSPA